MASVPEQLCPQGGGEAAAAHPKFLPCMEGFLTGAEAVTVPLSIYLDFSPLYPYHHKLIPQYLMSSSFSTKCYKIFVGFSNPVFFKEQLEICSI